MIAINNNPVAESTANSLTSHYGRLQTSTQRLSSGLRINSAADDAAGLAIREMMRADIAALNQGVRNANDAISMIQTFDGALSVIDEKLIRMKELAEQAATGTYDSIQRLMIDSEFQAMGSEIDRIANATDFNGVKLLCTKMITWYTTEQRFVITDPGSISNLTLPAGKNGTPVPHGINANNYVNENNPTRTINVSLTAQDDTRLSHGNLVDISTPGGPTTYRLGDEDFTAAVLNTMTAPGSVPPENPVINYDGTSWTVTDDNHPGGYRNVDPVGTIVSANGYNPRTAFDFSMQDKNGNDVDLENLATTQAYKDITSINVNTKDGTYDILRKTVTLTPATAQTVDYTASYNHGNRTVTVRLANGGTVTMALDNELNAGDTISFDINFAGKSDVVPVAHHGVDPNQKVKIHFGSGNDSAEDYYYIRYQNCTMDGLGLSDVDIQTQGKAQDALVQITDAIVKKDQIRADYGATQNRLENTITNLKTQAENLQASESRISDADIAQEMMNFVRSQILTQSAVAMLAQANSLPQIVMTLVG